MRALNILALLLIIFGGLSRLLVGLFHFDLATIFGGQAALLAHAVHVLVGLSAIWQLMPPVLSFDGGEIPAQHKA
jgi:uncharacterized membrane protein YuzA (DUF378 family)